MRPIESGPLIDQEIEELDAFLLSDDGLENAMDVSGLDGFLCAVLSGPNVIMPSEWMRWVWDSTEGKQSPEFTSEKQAQRILDLLIRHANDIAVTLTQFPQYYEPLFLARAHKGRTVSIVDRGGLGLRQGHRTRPFGLATALRSASRLVRGHPSLPHRKRLGQAEGISRGLPGCRWETSGVRGIDSASRPQHPCVLACPPCTCERHHRRYATTDSQGARFRPQQPMPLWLWQEVQALPWSTEIVALTCGTQDCLRPPSSLLKGPRQACCATPAQDQKCWNAAAFEQSQFFDHTTFCGTYPQDAPAVQRPARRPCRRSATPARQRDDSRSAGPGNASRRIP